MSMGACKECGKERSDKAEKCPHCGAPVKKGIGAGKAVLIGVVILFLAGWLMSSISTPPTSSQKTASDPATLRANKLTAARGACRIALNRSLHDPDSAKLEPGYSWYTEERKNGTILVQPAGRAKNAYGAYINSAWDCVARPEGENVRVLSLKQIRP